MNSSQLSFEQTSIIQHVILQAISAVLDIPPSSIDCSLSFPALGGHSLSAVSLSKICKENGVFVPIETILLSSNVSSLVKCVSSVDSYWQALTDPQTLATLPIHRPVPQLHQTAPLAAESPLFMTTEAGNSSSTPGNGEYFMTEMQVSFIQGSQMNPKTNVINFYETYWSKDMPAMKEAWKKVIQLEPVFCSHFDMSHTQARRMSVSEAPFHWCEIVADNETKYRLEIEQQLSPPPDGNAFKIVSLLREPLALSISTIIWRVHHSLIDGYSASLVYEKVRRAAEGRSIKPGTPFDSVARSLHTLYSISLSSIRQFWKNQHLDHSSASDELLLPPSPASNDSTNDVGNIVTCQVSMDSISNCATSLGITPAAIFYSAWALVLSQYSNSSSVVFGVVHSGRNLPVQGIEDTIGPLMNTLPLMISITESASTSGYLRETFRRLVELGSMQYSRPEDGFSRHYSSIVSMEFEMVFKEEAQVRPLDEGLFRMASNVPLSILIYPDGRVQFSYQHRLYRTVDMELVIRLYHKVVLSLLEPTITIGACMDSMLPQDCRNDLLRMGNCISPKTSPSFDSHDLVQLFEAAAHAYPDTIALEKGEQQLTYSEVSEMADRVSQHLRPHVKPDEVVCVNSDRSLNWIIAILGILKSNAVYASLDPALPSSLRDANFKAVSAKVFLVPTLSTTTRVPRSCSVSFVIQNILKESTLGTLTLTNLPRVTRPQAPAYICFTSGSSGKPKPVLCTHEGLVAFQQDEEVRLFAKPGCRISQIMSPAFDGSIHEIFSALCYGATLVLPTSKDPFEHLKRATSAILTPSIAKILEPEDYPQLENVSFSPEQI